MLNARRSLILLCGLASAILGSGCFAQPSDQGFPHGLITVEELISQADRAEGNRQLQVVGVLDALRDQGDSPVIFLVPEKSWLQITQYEQIAPLTVHLVSTIQTEKPEVHPSCIGKYVKVTARIGKSGGLLELMEIWSVSLLETKDNAPFECLINAID